MFREEDRTTYRHLLNGRLHRDDGPAYYVQMNSGYMCREEYWFMGKQHRQDGPAVILRADWGVMGMKYYVGGILHRQDGPAVITYVNRRNVCERYYAHGVLHRFDGPAVNEVDKIEYWIDGQKHSIDHPCIYPWDRYGRTKYYLRNLWQPENQWREQTDPVRIRALISLLPNPIAWAVAEHYYRA